MSSRAAAQFYNLKIGFCNVNSIINKLHIITDFLSDYNIDIFGVCETWLMPDITDSLINISNFSVVRTDTTSQTRKHGVCFYVKNNISYVKLEVSCENVCAIHLISLNIYLLIVYRPPSNSADSNLALLNFLNVFCPSKEVIVVGDFNLPLIHWQSRNVLTTRYPPLHQSFMDIFTTLGLLQWVMVPTYINSGNTLDLAFTSEDDRVGDTEVLSPFPNCGHCPVIMHYYFQSGTLSNTNQLPKRSWHKARYNKINEQLLNIDWLFEFENLSLDSMHTRFMSILKPLIELYVPLVPNSPISLPSH